MSHENTTENFSKLSKASYSRKTRLYVQRTVPSEIRLTEPEFLKGIQTGISRQISCIRRKSKAGYGFDGEPWDAQIEGACAEAAVAIALNIPFVGTVDTFKRGGDVGPYQVRSTKYSTGKLIIHSDERAEDIFILATGTAPNFTVHGWISGKEAMSHLEWFYPLKPNRPPAWNVPQYALHPLSKLTGNPHGNGFTQ